MRRIRNRLVSPVFLVAVLACVLGLSPAYGQTPDRPSSQNGSLEASYNQGAVQLRWDAVGGSEIIGYNLYRQDYDQTAWLPVNRELIEVLKFREALPVAPVMVTYRLVPVDDQGKEIEALQITTTFTKLLEDVEESVLDPAGPGCPPITPTESYQTVSGSHTTGQFRDYCFTATTGTRYEFTTCTPGSATYDTIIDVRSADGSAILATDDDSCGVQSRVIWQAPSSGPFRARVRGYADSFGSFAMAYRMIAPPPPCTTITTTESFQTIAGSIASGQFRDYCFTATGGQRYEFTTCAPGSATFDTIIDVRSADGSTLLVSDDHTCGLQSRVIWPAPATGPYRARVRGSGPAAGNFVLAYRQVPSPGTGGTATNGIYVIFVGPDGRYTARTGPTHPVPGGRNLLYGGKDGDPFTTYNTIRSWTSNTTYTQGGLAATVNLGPFVTYNRVEGTGVRTVYELPGAPQTRDKMDIEQLVRINGTTFNNTTIEVTTKITNTGTALLAVGGRYFWDFQIGQDDGPTFQEIGPDAPVRVRESNFDFPTFTAYRIVNNDFGPPLYAVFGTVNGPQGIIPPPSQPDRLQFVCWDTVFSRFPFEYTVDPNRDIATMASNCRGFAGGDTALNYFFGPTAGTAIALAPGQSYTFSESIFASPPRTLPRFDVPPTPPSRCPETTYRIQSGTRIQFPVQASHPTSSTNVTLGATGLPTGSSFPSVPPGNPVSSTFAWMPTAGQVGFHTITFTATSGSDSVSHCIRIEVVPAPPPNNPPTFDSPPTPTTAPVSVRAAGFLTFTVQASDPDFGDTVSLSVSGLPTGADFAIPQPANPVSSLFEWGPIRSQVGTYAVTFTATDNHGASTTRVITIQVLPPGPDTEPPHCGAISLTAEIPRTATILVRDINSGLDTIDPITENADVVIPPFTPGTDVAVVVTGTKVAADNPAFIELDVADVAGNREVCQFFLVSNRAGQISPAGFTVTNPMRSRLLIANRGLTDLILYLSNGIVSITQDPDGGGYCNPNYCFMAPNGATYIDISSLVRAGSTLEAVEAFGNPGTFAELMISE
ncbi:MAG: hypothetical protein HYR55_16655 [Acidobacteria bacterium]|nr:hypothetical protein [Acidobacteriota bacterium]MBI3657416.1 hypothetical protein [Acidobacteriota bacterium]